MIFGAPKILDVIVSCYLANITLVDDIVAEKIKTRKITEYLNPDIKEEKKFTTFVEGFDLVGAFQDSSNSELCPVINVELYSDSEGKEKWDK